MEAGAYSAGIGYSVVSTEQQTTAHCWEFVKLEEGKLQGSMQMDESRFGGRSPSPTVWYWMNILSKPICSVLLQPGNCSYSSELLICSLKFEFAKEEGAKASRIKSRG
jgi:hypothetical protein